MALRDILIRLDPAASGVVRLKLAADMAKRHGARLIGLYISNDTGDQQALERAGQMGLAPAAEMSAVASRLANGLKSRREEAHRQFEEELRLADLAGEWRDLDGSASDITIRQSRYCDLCIVGQGASDDAPSSFPGASTERTLLLSGRPILMVPSQPRSATLGRKIVVGWDGGRAASRSLHDALAVLAKADAVDVVTINPAAQDSASNRQAGDDMAAHLSRHGCRVNVVRLERGASVAEALCGYSTTADADLIVAGCYGHSRIGEWLLGGVTRDLLRQKAIPVLMSF